MTARSSIGFFDDQFRRQVRDRDFALNPFEAMAMRHLSGDVLDFGCGLGNLSVAAAQRGCRVVAMDASDAAVTHLRAEAQRLALSIEVVKADLREQRLQRDFDAIACIGLLMFFDCSTAYSQLEEMKHHVRPGGVLVLNVLVEGTTYLDMFEESHHCLFAADEVDQRLASWTVVARERRDFDAPGGTRKSFLTVVARRPGPDVRQGVTSQA